MSDLRSISVKIEEFVMVEATRLLGQCTEEQQAFAKRLMDARDKERMPQDWRSMHELARRTLMKQDTSQEITR